MPENISIKALSGSIGAIISGLQLNSLTPDHVAPIRGALKDHLVVFFRNQKLDARSLRDVAASFGTPVPYPYVAGLEDLPEVIEVIKHPDDLTNFGGVWHSDTAYLPEPALGALLYAETVPQAGGDTLFTNMYQVHDALSPGMRALLSNLSAINDADNPAIASLQDNSWQSIPLFESTRTPANRCFM